jgi:lysophospholipase L1-like esterase
MNRRLACALAALLALVALACKSAAGSPGSGSPGTATTASGATPTPAPRSDLPSSMVALGDSVTAGYGACPGLNACPRNSWATGDGTLVDSHYKRILAGNPAMKGNAHNLAEAGATIDDLPGQAAAAVGLRPDYVTVLVGANDACRSRIGDMTGTGQFQAQLSVTLATLRAGLPRARVLVLSIPDVYRVWEVAHPSRTAQQVWALGVCPTLLRNATSTAPADAARRQQFRDRVDAYNSILARACHDYGPRCRTDNGAVHAASFGIDLLSSVDFFHPNVAGQTQLAKVSYPGTFTW